MKFNLVPLREFVMGSPESELMRFVRQRPPFFYDPQHLVKITKPFYLSVHEVTQTQYERVMGNNPSLYKGANKPVEQVSWNDAVEFCRRLSEQEGVEYRLPTEAEWEYACRAGTTTAFSFGDDATEFPQYAWCRDRFPEISERERSTHQVGRLIPNAWGLFDMHGNVLEWCHDWLAAYGSEKVVNAPAGPPLGTSHVLRGGAFNTPPQYVRAACRYVIRPAVRSLSLGFRVARTYNAP